ncbi:MAG: SufE family protein [Xanthomonadales bacterium]|nr:SufE family protein [Xanthomonadales bacterium]
MSAAVLPREPSAREAAEALVEEFAALPDWAERYQYLIELGRTLPPFPEEWKTEANRLHGCQSQVWLLAERRGDRLLFHASSDSAIVSGLIALLLRVYSGRSAEEILATPPDFLDRIGLRAHLSLTRANGLAAMLRRIRELASG